MKNTAKAILILIAVILLSLVVAFISKTTVGVSDVKGAFTNLKYANSLNGETFKNKYESDIKEKESLKKKVNTLTETAKAKEDEYKEALKAKAEEVGEIEILNEQNAYGKFVDAATLNKVDLNKFFVNDAASFTVTYIGKIDELNNTLKTIKDNTDAWGLNIGNVSLRQNYDAYNLGRSYDEQTRLEWYDYKIVNAFGEVIDLETLNGNTEEEDITIMYSTNSLDEIKFDTEGRDTELLASNSYYEDQISKVIANYGEQLVILENKGYESLVEAEIKIKLEEEYNRRLESLKEDKEAAAAKIENKYAKQYNDQKKAATQKLKNYEAKIDELKKMLADSTGIEYKLDLTMRYVN